MSFTWNLLFPQTFLIINVLTGIITGCGCQESVNAIKTNWWKNWENYLTALIQLGWRLLKHSLCFPAPWEVLWHQRTRALLHAASSAEPPRLHCRLPRTRLPEIKHLLAGCSWRLLSQLCASHDRGTWCTFIQRVTSFRCHPKRTGVQLPLPSSTLQWHQPWVIRADRTQEAFKKGWKWQ